VLYHTNDVQAVQAFETVGVENAKEREREIERKV
jgi:hypothetical protein